MKNAFFLSLKDIRKNKFFLIILYLQIFISVAVITMVAAKLPGIMKLKNHLSVLEENNVVTFKSYYKASNRIANMPQNVKGELTDIFDNEKVAFSTSDAYSAQKYPDTPVLIAVGNFAGLYPIGAKAPCNQPQAYIGNKIKDIPVGSAFTFDGDKKSMQVKVAGRLLPNSSYYHRNFEQPLDDSIVIVTPYKTMTELFGTFYDEELVQNTDFINPTKDEITQYVKTINTSKIINVLPYSASDLYGQSYKSEFFNQWFFLIFFSIAFIFNLIGIIANLMNMVNKNLRAFAIHYMYGATIGNITQRIMFYVFLILIPPIFIAYIFIYIMGIFRDFHVFAPQLYFVLFVLASAAVVSVYPVKKLHTTDLQNVIRRD